jgi:glycosyltransferase involved in cell wall biosynthesis
MSDLQPPQGATLRTSVVLCTYNGEKYLSDQLDSIFQQTRLPDELVLSDDGSTDRTCHLLEMCLPRATSLGIAVTLQCHDTNRGYIENFSAALRRATGDVVFLCDQDDVWSPEKIARMTACFEEDAVLTLLFTDARLVDAHLADLGCSLFEALQLTEEEKSMVRHNEAFGVLLRRSMVTGATAAFRRELIDEALPVEPGWIHDEWLAIMASRVGKVGYLDAPLIDYRQHGDNQIGMRKRTFADRWADMRRPRQALMSASLKRMASLEARLVAAGLAPRVVREVMDSYAEHFSVRLRMGTEARFKRMPLIFREALTGRYRQFSNGRRSMLRDMLRRN